MNPDRGQLARLALVVLALLIVGGSWWLIDQLGGRPPTAAPAATAQLEWVTRAPVPTPRTEVAAAVIDGAIYVVGGFDHTGATVGTVERYDSTADRWEPLPDLIEPVNHPAAAGFGGELWVIGGTSDSAGGSTTTVQIFNPATKAWRTGPPLPQPRTALGAAVLGDSLYAVGGSDGPSRTELYRLTTGATRWEGLRPMAESRDHLAVAADSRFLYAIAGRKDGNFARNRSEFEIYDPATNRWQPGPDLPTARSGLGAAVAGGKLFVVGGEGPLGTFEEVERYDPSTGQWARLTNLPTARHGLGVVVLDDHLHVLTGGPTPGLSTTGTHELLAVQ